MRLYDERVGGLRAESSMPCVFALLLLPRPMPPPHVRWSISISTAITQTLLKTRSPMLRTKSYIRVVEDN